MPNLPKRPLLFIRADASARIGTGHVLRCLALAEQWRQAGGVVTFLSHGLPEGLQRRLFESGCATESVPFACPDPRDAEWTGQKIAESGASALAIDGYHFNPNYLARVQATGVKTLVCEDGTQWAETFPDIFLIPSPGFAYTDYACPPESGDAETRSRSGPRQLRGPRYALIRREFSTRKSEVGPIAAVAQTILVTLGGSDPDNVTRTVLDALALLPGDDWQARVLVGPANPRFDELETAARKQGGRVTLCAPVSDMATELLRADCAITAGGGSCLEMACLGLPMLLLTIADNQRQNAQALHRAGAAHHLGCPSAGSPQSLADAIHALRHDPARRFAMRHNGRALVDGEGAARVAAALLEKR